MEASNSEEDTVEQNVIIHPTVSTELNSNTEIEVDGPIEILNSMKDVILALQIFCLEIKFLSYLI